MLRERFEGREEVREGFEKKKGEWKREGENELVRRNSSFEVGLLSHLDEESAGGIDVSDSAASVLKKRKHRGG